MHELTKFAEKIIQRIDKISQKFAYFCGITYFLPAANKPIKYNIFISLFIHFLLSVLHSYGANREYTDQLIWQIKDLSCFILQAMQIDFLSANNEHK